MEIIGVTILNSAGIAICLLPMIIAIGRKHPQLAPTILIDILAGQSGIGSAAWSAETMAPKVRASWRRAGAMSDRSNAGRQAHDRKADRYRL